MSFIQSYLFCCVKNSFFPIFTFSCIIVSVSLPAQGNQQYIENADHPNPRMRYKVTQSHFTQMDSIFQLFATKLDSFGRQRYEALRPLILGKDITSLQQAVSHGLLTYQELTLYFLYRIRLYETDPEKSLNAIISLAPNAIRQAALCDQQRKTQKSMHPLFGIPVLIKDNVGLDGTATTAGAVILRNNRPKDAFIVNRLREKGAVLIGKTNLSEWAYYFCNGCPLGYSAVGGQTFNPFGRKRFESGGSSSGSGVAIAAGYAVAAVGTETSGSILSPSALNSLVGLKPTVGLLSRQGIVPISSTLDTPGPMTTSVKDNVILLDALAGFDPSDDRARLQNAKTFLSDTLQKGEIKGKRFGVFTALLTQASYAASVALLELQGAVIIKLDTVSVPLPGYLNLLNHDMKSDLANYLQYTAFPTVTQGSVKQIMDFNLTNPEQYAPYGQGIFEGIEADTLTGGTFERLKDSLLAGADGFFQRPARRENIDYFLSINNLHAAYAALAFRPCLTIPIGTKEDGEPLALTIIGTSWEESALLQTGLQIEKHVGKRILPQAYP